MALTGTWSRRRLLAGAAAGLALAGCGRRDKPPAPAPKAVSGPPPAAAQPGSLAWAVAGDWRDADKGRDRWRHPRETLAFFGLKPGMTVLEMWPGAGWYTQILAPYLRETKGKLYAASFESPPGDTAAAQMVDAYKLMFSAKPQIYGDIGFTRFGPSAAAPAPAGTADIVLFIDTVHAWMAAGLAEKAFRDAFAALKPGGVLGVQGPRGIPGKPQDALAADGYVQVAYVRRLAEEAGFRFDQASEVGANPADTKDHPFGAATLPPERRSAAAGASSDPAFDHRRFDTIGEPDRMTLRFLKP